MMTLWRNRGEERAIEMCACIRRGCVDVNTHLSDPFQTHSNLSKMQSFS